MTLGVVTGCVLLLITVECGFGQNDTTTTTATPPTASTSPVPTTTISPEQECLHHNKSCDDCLQFAHCLWCYKDSSCKQYPTGHILPRDSDCPLDQARWGLCGVNFKVLIIAMSCIGGAIILLISCCCIYCCCCRKGSNKRFMADEAKYERQKEERKRKSEERRSERKAKTDEIRRKYGLVKDNPYSRFDADA